MSATVLQKNRAPVSFVRCPVHGAVVALDGEQHLIGRCDACAREAEQATRAIRRINR